MTGVIRRTRAARVVAGVLATCLAGGLLAQAVPADAARLSHPAPIQERNSATVTADALPTAQIGTKSDGTPGVVWTLKVAGDTVFAGGDFANARPAGAALGDASQVDRANLLSFSLSTGELTSFAPNVNGSIRTMALSPDGRTLYVGGTFTRVNDEPRTMLAAFDVASGALLESFHPSLTGAYVTAIAVTDSVVYVGGALTSGNNVRRNNLLAFDASGNLLGWAPTADRQVDAMVVAPGNTKLIIGGRFEKVNRKTHRGLAALSLTSGSVLSWAAGRTIRNGKSSGKYAGHSGIYSLSTDGTLIYGSGWATSSATSASNLEGTFAADPATGAIRWIDDCHGDIYSSYSDGTNLYLAGHPHDCESVGGFPQKKSGTQTGYPSSNMRFSLVLTTSVQGTLWRSPRTSWQYTNWNGKPAPAIIDWFPDWVTGTATGSQQASWTVAGAGDYVVFGGEFPYVNNLAQQGLVRFARPNVSTPKQGPRFSASTVTKWTPSVVSLSSGTVRLTIPGNWDRDNARLTYTVIRSDVADPVYTTSFDSYFWSRPTLTYTDTGLTPGSTYTYRVTASDPDGNKVTSTPVSVTVTGSYLSPYADRVVSDGALAYWNLDKDYGVSDVLGLVSGSSGTGVVSAPGILGAGVQLAGNTNSRLVSVDQQLSPDTFSAEIWFRTTSKKGGKLLGFGSAASGNSLTYDRHLYLSNSGKVSFGITQNHSRRVLTSKKTYRDGKWHQAVVTEGSSGAALYLDGSLVASSTSMFKAEDYYGYWRLGGDSTKGWPGRGSSDNFAGYLDEFSTYGVVLTADQVRAHYAEASGVGAPAASFTTQVDQQLGIDVTAASGGSGATYAWDFGDGATASGSAAEHTYDAAGSYTVTLTVTDEKGIRARSSQTVSVPSTTLISAAGAAKTEATGSAAAAVPQPTQTSATPTPAVAESTDSTRTADSAGASATP